MRYNFTCRIHVSINLEMEQIRVVTIKLITLNSIINEQFSEFKSTILKLLFGSISINAPNLVGEN